MIGRLLAVVGLLGVASAGGMVWLLVRGERRRSRAVRARLLRRLAWASALVAVVTVAFLHPGYWDLAIVGAVARALAAVVFGSAIVTVGGAAAVLDGAALVGGHPAPVPHGGQVLAAPVLYQVFWGPAWDSPTPAPALAQAVTFQRTLGTSAWSSAVVHAGFGIRSLRSGGCWVDPAPAPPGSTASTTTAGPFAAEVRAVVGARAEVRPCPGLAPAAVPSRLPVDAVVALWLDPTTAYAIGGVSAHGAVPWAGRPDGVAAAGFTGAFAAWGTPACSRQVTCRFVARFATPAYALSHEFVEAATNPFGQGWYANVPVQWSARYFLAHGPTSMLGSAPQFQGEVADLCEPGQPDASDRPPSSAHGDGGLTLAAFYRPGRGCT